MYKNFSKLFFCLGLVLISFAVFAQTDSDIYGKAQLLNQKDNGFRGIWYMNQPLKDSEYKYKYAGGCATYPSNHYPFSVYVPEVNKTFFCYGGTNSSNKTLFHEVSYFDHETGEVARPIIVLDKATTDAHDNPVIQVDKDGYIWLFSTSHGTGRPSFIHRSVKPYNITKFERIPATKIVNDKEVPMDNFSYLQMYYSPKHGFTGLFTHYEKVGGRVIAWMTSKDGIHWSEWKDLSHLGVGHYQSSANKGNLIGTSFNYHPDRKVRGGLNYRTNLYYLQSKDFGKTWHTVDGTPIELPLNKVTNRALIHDYDSEGKNVYINDINFDKKGHPVIVYITSKGPTPGPEDGPREWHTAHWTGKKWEIKSVTISDHNYDMGSIYIDDDGTWRIIGPTETGPQPYNTGGEMAMWISKDEGQSWKKVKQLTSGSEYNHSYPRRPVNANPDFYTLWSDGHGRQPSKSRLYFSDKNGNVFVLPEKMTNETEKPLQIQKRNP